MSEEQLREALSSGGPALGVSLLQIPFLFDGRPGGNEFVFLASILAGAAGFYQGYNKYKYTNTPEYREFVELYKEFISDIAKMYKQLGFKGDFVGSVAYEFCVHNGIFSQGEVCRDPEVDNYNESIKYCGGIVATGRFCCRHNASLLTDVLTEMGGLATDISVFIGDEENESYANHLVTGVLCNGKKLVVDPMSYGDIYFFDDRYSKGYMSIVSSEETRYRIVSSVFSDEKDNKKRLKEFMRYECFDDFDEIHQIESAAKNEARKYFAEYEAFHEEEKPKILQLAKLNKAVSSYGRKIN